MEQIRSFIAIELGQGLRNELAALQAKLKSPRRPWVKWVDPQGIHLTLRFLGYVDASKTDDIAAAMAEAVRGTAPFKLVAGGLGAFPNPRRAQVIWVGIGGEVARLARLHQRLEEQLAALGFAAEARGFSAHLTLGRLRHDALPRQRQELGRLAAETGFSAGSAIRVDALSLMQSQLTPKGAVYSRLAEVPLKE